MRGQAPKFPSKPVTIVSKMPADGYTPMLLPSSFTTDAAIQTRLPFDPVGGLHRDRQAQLRLVNADMSRILAAAQMKEVFLREGAEPAPMTPARFASTIKSEIEGWKQVAARSGIKPE